jgi:formylglycine-generating enzyme required for sulfatase activity
LHLPVPTCDASRADTIAIPAGGFMFGGLGDPPSPYLTLHADLASEETHLVLPAFAMDRTEVTNAAYAVFASMSALTGIAMPTYPRAVPALRHSADPASPVVWVSWIEARAYCRYLGKDLPTVEQWQKAQRGGDLVDGKPNPFPRRTLPWGAPEEPIPANIMIGDATAAPVGSFPRDRSPFGVMDLGGNAAEWTSTVDPDSGFPLIRGGSFLETTPEDLFDALDLENQRPMRTQLFHLGMRCATTE